MQKKLMMTALLFVVALGSWAQTGNWSEESNRNTSWGSSYDTATELTISSANDFAQFAYMVNEGINFGGKTVKLEGSFDLSTHYWTPMGYWAQNNDGKSFNGTFDGNGQTISGVKISEGDGSLYQGLFGQVGQAGTVKNLKLANSYVKADSYVGGIVGYNYGTITNCLVDEGVTIEGYDSGSSIFGGIAGLNRGTITGCVSKAKLSNKYGQQWGGIAGNNSKFDSVGDKAIIKDCLFCGSFTDSGNQYIGAIVGYEDSNATISYNFYYGCAIGQADTGIGKGNSNGTPADVKDGASRVYSVSIDEAIHAEVTFNVAGETEGREYTIAGITVTNHSMTDNVFRATSEAEIQFTEIDEQDIYKYSSWNVKDDATRLTTNQETHVSTFTMPAKDVVVTATEYVKSNMLDWIDGDGTEAHPYLITTKEQLKKVAIEVKTNTSEKNITDKFFRLENDLDLTGESFYGYYIIGEPSKPFKGTFDGNGHTISGISVVETELRYIGIFGYAQNATIKNVSVKNSAFQALQYVGAIVGYASYTTIENCHVGDDVTITAYIDGTHTEDTYFRDQGGIAGYISYSSIKGCSSGAKFALEYNGDHQKYTAWGGIVGLNNVSTVQDCLFYGDLSVSNNVAAFCAIAGLNTEGSTLTHNYYVVTEKLKSPNGFHITSSDEKQDAEGQAEWCEKLDIYTAPASFGELQKTYGEEDGCVGISAYQSGMKFDGMFFGRNVVETAEVTYIDADGTEQTVTANVLNGNETVLDKEWYVVNDNVTFNHSVTINSNVNIILADGKTMSAESLKSAVEENSATEEYPLYDLTIYGQAEQTGVMSLNSASTNIYVKDFIQNGGQITLNYWLFAKSQNAGNITINRGKFTTESQVWANGVVSLNGGQIEMGELNVSYTGNDAVEYNILLSYEENEDYIKVGTYNIYDSSSTGYPVDKLKIQTDRPFMDENYDTYTEATFADNAYNINGKKLTPGRIKMADTADNKDLLYKYLNKTICMVLQDRKLWKGEWNTISLPFDLTKAQIAAQDNHPLKDADIRKLSSANFDNGTLTLTFTDNLLSQASDNEKVIQKGEPYIVKPAGDKNSFIENPEFKNVKIDEWYVSETDNGHTYYTQVGCLDFMPNFAPYEIASENKTILYMGAENKLYYPNAAMTINSFRAYFRLNGLNAGDMINEVKAIRLNFGDDEATGIISLTDDASDSASGWYTLDGRQLSGEPTVRGIYINNGKKVAVK